MKVAARIEQLGKQADGLASFNLLLSPDKVALESKLQDTLRSLFPKEDKEKDLETRLAQVEQLLVDEVVARKSFEEKAVSGFIKGYQHAQGELLEKDPKFDGSWMSLGFDKEALLGGEEEDEEEEGGEEEGEQGPVGEGNGVDDEATEPGKNVFDAAVAGVVVFPF